jgi:hypothetical protein
MTKPASTDVVDIDEADEFGPAMKLLNSKQRAFVLAMAADPRGNAAEWARAAGYSDKAEGAKVHAHRLLRKAVIEDAIFEVARRNMNTLGPLLAARGMLRIAANERHPEHSKMLLAVADRVGLHPKSEHKVMVEHKDDRGMMELVARLANELGVEARELIGANTTEGEAHRQKLIDVTPTQAKVPVVESDPFEEVASIRLAEPK